MDVMGISEIGWLGSGECQIENHIIYYTENEDKTDNDLALS